MLFSKFTRSLRRDGLTWTIVRIFLHLLRKPNEIQRAKIKILNALLHKYNYTVAYGTFKGMKLNPNPWWSKNDLVTQILNVYENHVLEKLIHFSKKKLDFINIGAGDGYFAIGVAFAKMFEKVYAFESSEIAQDLLRQNIEINKCNDIIKIKSVANFESLKNIISNGNSAVILIDIEGFEFELLNEELLKCLNNCYVICELHPTLVLNGYEKQHQLISRSKNIFNSSIIHRETYNPNQFIELDQFSDEERLIAFGEGRNNNMKWLVLEPKLHLNN